MLSIFWIAQVLEAKVGWAAWALEQGVVQAADLARKAAPAHGEAVGEAAVCVPSTIALCCRPSPVLTTVLHLVMGASVISGMCTCWHACRDHISLFV